MTQCNKGQSRYNHFHFSTCLYSWPCYSRSLPVLSPLPRNTLTHCVTLVFFLFNAWEAVFLAGRDRAPSIRPTLQGELVNNLKLNRDLHSKNMERPPGKQRSGSVMSWKIHKERGPAAMCSAARKHSEGIHVDFHLFLYLHITSGQILQSMVLCSVIGSACRLGAALLYYYSLC